MNLPEGPDPPTQAIAANSLTRNITSLCMDSAIPLSPSAPHSGPKSRGLAQAAAAPQSPAATAAAGPSASTATPSSPTEQVAPPAPALLTLDNAGFFAGLRLPPPSPGPVRNLQEAALFNTALPNARLRVCPASPSGDATSEPTLDLDDGEAAGAWGGWLTGQAAEAAEVAAAAAVASPAGAGSMDDGMTSPAAKRGYGSQRMPAELRSCAAGHHQSGGSYGGGGGGGGGRGLLFLSDSATGSISRLARLPASAAALLLLLETALVDAIPAARPLGGGTHAAHRGTFRRQQVQLHFAPDQRRVVDGDLLHLFLGLPLSQQLRATALLWSMLVEREGSRLKAAAAAVPLLDGEAEEGGEGGPSTGGGEAAPASSWMLPGGEEAGAEPRGGTAASPSTGLNPVGGSGMVPLGCRGAELPHGHALVADLVAAPEGVVFALLQLVQHALAASGPA